VVDLVTHLFGALDEALALGKQGVGFEAVEAAACEDAFASAATVRATSPRRAVTMIAKRRKRAVFPHYGSGAPAKSVAWAASQGR
jgi:hypothetical protein